MTRRIGVTTYIGPAWSTLSCGHVRRDEVAPRVNDTVMCFRCLEPVTVCALKKIRTKRLREAEPPKHDPFSYRLF